jgi:DNA-binding protein H-NS
VLLYVVKKRAGDRGAVFGNEKILRRTRRRPSEVSDSVERHFCAVNGLNFALNPIKAKRMTIDLKTLSPEELLALIANANAQMHVAQATQVQTVKGKIEILLSNSGLTLDEVYPSRGKTAAGKKGGKGSVPPKYQNPSDPSQAWSGRGRQPLWFSKALRRRGVTVEDLLIGGAIKSAAPPVTEKSAKKAPKKVARRMSKKATAKKAA